MSETAVIFSTLGDQGGIGPELVARTLECPEATAGVKRLVVGRKDILDRGREIAGVDTDLPVYRDFTSAVESSEPVVFLHHADAGPDAGSDTVIMGESTVAAGRSDLAVARFAADLSRTGQVDAFVFAPVNKKSLSLGGSDFEGYKAYIADYLGINGISAEINTIGPLWTTRISSHVPIADVPRYVTKDRILEIVRYFDRELRRFGYDDPKIAVAGLNPHNGDGGLFGREEIDEIGPAVEAARQSGLNVDGPFSPDTVFVTAQERGDVGIVSMYHDQCQIATKLLGFDEGVTYFGGLPFAITTPAHGTAFDIAGQGVASSKPMLNALRLARRAALVAKGQAAATGPDHAI